MTRSPGVEDVDQRAFANVQAEQVAQHVAQGRGTTKHDRRFVGGLDHAARRNSTAQYGPFSVAKYHRRTQYWLWLGFHPANVG
jgi:predicted HD phosphohydrolase